MTIRHLLVFTVLLAITGPVEAQDVVVDDFESYSAGDLPTGWQYLVDNKRLEPFGPLYNAPREQFTIVSEGGNLFTRVYTEGEAMHLTLANGHAGFQWDAERHPVLAWDWRARRLPTGAREDVERLNDTGAGLYVVFKVDGFIIKRPKSIKYTYSSSLPVGTVVSYGSLRVVVVSSALDGYGTWQHIERNVMDDYRRLFNEEPPTRPVSIRLWGDSDNTGGFGEADFDNIRLRSDG